MKLAADMGRHAGRAEPDRNDAPYRQFKEATGRRSTYPLPIPVQTNRATSVRFPSSTLLAELDLRAASFMGAELYFAHLEFANLKGAHLEGAKLYKDVGAEHIQEQRRAHLEYANI
jgi:uncharacterized protein YjbI with pentapeptide repeats